MSTRMRSGVCAFDEQCPFFLGQPACYTGFALFATAFLVSLIARIRRAQSGCPMATNAVIAVAGTLFARNMAIEELAGQAEYRL